MKKFALIGKDISYTVSPFVHKRLFSLKNSEASYVVLDGEADDIFAEAKSLDGYNVTKPYKEKITSFLSNLSDEAKLFGSVNTAFKNVGYNTDVSALEKCLKKKGLSLSGNTLILGFGGLGKAVAARALELSCKVTVAVRSSSLEKTKIAITALKARFQSGEISVSDVSSINGQFDLLINATPVGTFPKHLESPVPKSVVAQAKAVFDCVYNPNNTALVLMAESMGISSCGGLEMLVWQAAEAQKIWLGSDFSEEKISLVIDETSAELQNFPTNVVLSGFMGAGKTEVAKKIGELTCFSVLDVDDVVESRGKTISEIFASGGETAFRAAEKQAVAECSKKRSSVIATGGGSVLDEDNVKALKSGGKIIFLDAPFDVLYGRIAADCSLRPIASRLSRDELLALYDKRRWAYLSSADFVVDASGSVEDVARSVISLF